MPDENQPSNESQQQPSDPRIDVEPQIINKGGTSDPRTAVDPQCLKYGEDEKPQRYVRKA